jgi:hypothetical protein
MRKVREAALSRATAPDFLPLTHHEIVRLRLVPAWVRWLYLELLCCADLRTGRGKTSWPRLLACLDFDRAPTGRQRAGGVTLRQARDALEDLAELGLVARDKARNEAQGFLFFHVQPRTGFSAPAHSSGRGSGRAVAPQKPGKTRDKPVTDAGVPAGVRAGGSGVNSYPLPPTDPKLSTGAVTLPVGQVLDRLQAMRPARGKTRPPKGG